MQYKKILFSLIVLVLVSSFFVLKAQAQGKVVDVQKQSQSFMDIGAEQSGLKEKGVPAKSIGIFMAEIIKAFMGGLGITMVLMIFIAGFMLITAHGEEEKVALAYKIIQGSVMGLLVALSAYAITSFVTKRAMEVTGYGVSYLNSEILPADHDVIWRQTIII